MDTNRFFGVVFLLLLHASQAHGEIKSVGKPANPLPIHKKIIIDFSIYIDSLSFIEQETAIAKLTTTISSNTYSRENKRTMLRFLRKLTIKKAFKNKRFQEKLDIEMANISARMKLYPMAMQFYYNEMQQKYATDSSTQADISQPVNEQETMDIAFDSTAFLKQDNRKKDSERLSVKEILRAFDDNKEATDYALMVNVKQPVNGKRKSFKGINNVGHMFITLIKYNTDKSYVSRSFGFYPQKTGLLSATPFKPTTAAVFKDDALHDWDEAIGKFISYRRFVKIIKVLCKYEYKMYNLNENNCTDFGLAIASLSGINIQETKGTWPLGKGNNPANAGQSIRDNKLADTNSNSAEAVFIFNQ